ncbi:hypothetical protein DERF_011171 [Dermatophagoides farinae]|uniref:Uncharacterized protein n=1 Tax=Dermatophagoides farinae TaxID=6954 RepID=A0A922L025_DERFA|nr:hypothetical protein DERF_011171 [Dermatophagoides farinae]
MVASYHNYKDKRRKCLNSNFKSNDGHHHHHRNHQNRHNQHHHDNVNDNENDDHCISKKFTITINVSD